MTSSPSPRPDDSSGIPAAPAATAVAAPSPDPDTWPEVLLGASPEAPCAEDPCEDPLPGLVRAAVADRPLEDVVRLITLLERRPEHARTTTEALRAAGVGRSLEDVTRLVTLLTRPPRTSGSADEAIRAAAECRPLEEVTRLMELLRSTPVEPHCVRAAVEAVAVGRPVEELAELIARLAAERPAHGTALPEPMVAEAVEPAPVPVERAPVPVDTQPAVAIAVPAPDEATPVPDEAAPGPGRTGERTPDGGSGSPKAPRWPARVAALLMFLCGAAHAPRYWEGLSQPVLQATLTASGLCVLLALVLPVRTVLVRLAAATVSLLFTTALAAVQVLGGTIGHQDRTWLRSALLAPPWLAGTVAATAAVAALVGLLATLVTADARRTEEC
ncbi:hypothetical protein [Streptomyces sp. PTD9-10]|uniref:hypothetical protein n=1 Tax=Streptomyces sp. PTD9-10 TaxID=3120151 RepID=UPI003008F455